MTQFDFKRLSRDLSIAIIISLLCLAIAAAGNTTANLLRYDAQLIQQAELWRLITPHFVHLSTGHLFMNIAGLFLVFVFFARCISWQYWLLGIGLSCVGISVLIYFFNPEIQWYVGLSGVLHTLFLMGGLADIKVRKWEGLFFTGLIIIKLLYEQWFGPLPGSEETAGGPVLVDAHLYGAIIGAVLGLFILKKK